MRHFIQQNPIVFWATFGLVGIVAVLFVSLPSRQARIAVVSSNTTHDAWRPEVRARVDVLEVQPPEVDGSAAHQDRPTSRRDDVSRQKVARERIPDGRSFDARSDASGAFTVQVGSFSNKDAAKRMASKLKASGYPAFVKLAQASENARMYRVRVGMFPSRGEAQRYGDSLVEREKIVRAFFPTIND